MTITSALILDLALLAVIIVTVIVAANRGFLATLVRLCGTALALFASWIAASRLSTAVFENFFRNGLVEKTAKMISEGGQTSIQSIIDKLAAFLPDSLVQSILGGTDKLQSLVDSNAPDVASQVVEQVIAPLFLPIISKSNVNVVCSPISLRPRNEKAIMRSQSTCSMPSMIAP